MDGFRGDVVDVKMLGPEWRHRMVDVCGAGAFRHRWWRDVFVTHTHLDHLLLREYVHGAKLRFFTAPKYFPELATRYGDEFEVQEYLDVIETEHTSLHSNQYKRVETYGFFVKDALIIPESDEAEELIAEYSAKFTFVFAAHQSHLHPTSFNNQRRDVFIVDNRVWKPYAPNVIPKIAFSCSDSDRRLFEKYCRRL